MIPIRVLTASEYLLQMRVLLATQLLYTPNTLIKVARRVDSFLSELVSKTP